MRTAEGAAGLGGKEPAQRGNGNHQQQTQRGQKFVDRDLHESVVIQRLGAALHCLLRHPISQSSHQTFKETFTVREKGCVENDKDAPENQQRLKPNLAVPHQPKQHGKQTERQEHRHGAQDASLGVIQRVETEQLDGQGGEQRQDKQQLQHHQVKTAGEADFFPTQPAHQPDNHKNQGCQQHRANNRERHEQRAGGAALGQQV